MHPERAAAAVALMEMLASETLTHLAHLEGMRRRVAAHFDEGDADELGIVAAFSGLGLPASAEDLSAAWSALFDVQQAIDGASHALARICKP
jgi:hypothetical protein